MMFRSPHMFKRVTIVGVGLMGGSLGLALKKHSLAQEVVGLSQKQSSLLDAVKYKAIDIAETDARAAFHHAELIVFATPVESILKLLPAFSPHIRRGCLITDLGSVKSEIVDVANKHLQTPAFFVGSHPLVGSEKQGVEFAKAELFEGANCIITPTDKTNSGARDRIKLLWSKLGSKVTSLTPEEHDEILSFTSHLPHVLAYGLVGALPEKSKEFVAQGFKDTTRIASSSPQMWNDICMNNSKNVIKALDELIKNLSIIRKAILNKDRETLIQIFTRAKEKRDGLISIETQPQSQPQPQPQDAHRSH
jgi:prephenate dehydrogenase